MTAINEGQRAYEEWRARVVDTPEKRALYEEIAARSDLWLQLVEARMAAGVTPEELAQGMGTTKTQVTRIERNGYAYTLKTLRRYVKALGQDFAIEVRIQRQPSRLEAAAAAAP